MPPKAKLDTAYHDRRLERRLKEDPEFRAEFERQRREIAQIDSVVRQLDELRERAGMSKAELARAIGKEPSSVRRFFTADVNPELKTVAAVADALGAEVRVVASKNQAQRSKAAA
jgi:ribosome-binding protein aMBF1 (putative translation factor)